MRTGDSGLDAQESANLWTSSYEQYQATRKAEPDAKLLQEILAESTASDVGNLRLALARIVAMEDGVRSYGGGCSCSDNGCSGHVPETLKIARAALGLHALPDRPRVADGEPEAWEDE